MASGLVQRYASLCKLPLNEVEDIWRSCKKKCSQDGKKSQWDVVVQMLRENLNLTNDEGRIVFFEGVAESEIMAETPAYALIRVKAIEEAPESIRPLLRSAQGLTVSNYERLTLTKGGKPMEYPYERADVIRETSTSIGVGQSGCGSGAMSKIFLAVGLHVTHNGKEAVIKSLDKAKAIIQYVISGQEKEVPTGGLQLGKSFLIEDMAEIWDGMNPLLTEEERIGAFGSILMFENRLNYLPNDLLEAVVQAAQNHSEQGKFSLDDSDWAILTDKDIKPVNDVGMPQQPQKIDRMGDVPPTDQPEEGSGGSTETPNDTGGPAVRTPSQAEIKSIISKVGGHGESTKFTGNRLMESLSTPPPEKIEIPKTVINKKAPIVDPREARLKKSEALWKTLT